MMMKAIYNNECGHDIYLGSDKKSDFYLYLSDNDRVSICRRFNQDGDYSTHMFHPSIINSNAHHLLEKLKKILERNKNNEESK